MSEIDTRTYELGFVLVPIVSETEVPKLVEELKSAVSKADGTVSAEGFPEFIDLAYTMEKSIASKKMKYSQGYFGWLKFDATPEAVEGLKKVVDGMTEVVRYILVKTSVQNTVVFKKPKIEAKREAASDEEVTSLDESIDTDLKDDQEALPDVIDDVTVVAPVEEPVEKEEE